MTVFDAGPRAKTADFNAGDIGYVKRGQGHYIQNTGTTELRLVAVFKVPEYEEVSAVRLAHPHAAGAGFAAPEHRPDGAREISKRQAGSSFRNNPEALRRQRSNAWSSLLVPHYASSDKGFSMSTYLINHLRIPGDVPNNEGLSYL